MTWPPSGYPPADPPAAPPGPAGRGTAPTCYRHRDRETYVRCARCDRPICPDCMRSASVGFHCPECVQQGRRTTRLPTRPYGGRIHANDRAVTLGIIGICVVAWIVQQIRPAFTAHFVLAPYAPGFGGAIGGVAEGEYWRLLTAAFLHEPNNPLHILFNMYALFLVGPPVEAALGRVRFAAIYLVSALGGNAISYVFLPVGGSALGASGAIFGMFAAYYVLARRARLDTRWIAVIIAINLVLGFTLPNVDWHAHLGGLGFGVLLILVIVYAPRASRQVLQAGATVALVGAAMAIAVLHTAAVPAITG